ncbi:glycosyltransferase [Zhouia amylolytica]|uniref:Glycosyltransferase 2-like prokaryotic type domain-containing protein n=1 Tax=Zhouia amylolytica AD3 TaxID=1286632 RepID=W2UPD7_9FLAO|nr:glycosyltransferase family 2 protein [Zhouia amylolytica]ETN95789.1 hypothetical protein P278_15110 [Zhouia amylolytica AD3]
MKNVHLSVVSHNNEELIIDNFFKLPRIYGGFKLNIYVIDNLGSTQFKSLCKQNDVNYYSDMETRGYGGNNNKNYEIISPDSEDIFIVCNPDVTIQPDQFEELLTTFENSNADIFGVKVYESIDLSTFSSHNRKYPALLDPLVSLLFKVKLFALDPNIIAYPDWIGGAFMIFKSESYRKLEGFDESFFMYYEDVDICRRAKRKYGMKLIYNPGFYIVHEAQREGRKLFSKHFLMNLKSMIKYFFRYPTLRLITIKK